MFKAFNVNSLSSFRQLFYTSSLDKSGRVLSSTTSNTNKTAAAAGNGIKSTVAADYKIPDVSEYDTISSGWDAATMKWRMIQKPGGAHMKPQDFYRYEEEIRMTTWDQLSENAYVYINEHHLSTDEEIEVHTMVLTYVSFSLCASLYML